MYNMRMCSVPHSKQQMVGLERVAIEMRKSIPPPTKNEG